LSEQGSPISWGLCETCPDYLIIKWVSRGNVHELTFHMNGLQQLRELTKGHAHLISSPRNHSVLEYPLKDHPQHGNYLRRNIFTTTTGFPTLQFHLQSYSSQVTTSMPRIYHK
jgi:hypothetical protein